MVHFFVLLLALFHPFAGAATYTLEDLESLVSEKNEAEYFAHALDIRPSQRQDAWKTMTALMADVFTKKVLTASEIKESDFQKSEELFSWPVLHNDDVYKSRRQDIGLRYLQKCLRAEKPCLVSVEKFWEASSADPELGFKLSEMLATHPDAPPLWKYLSVSLKSPLSEFYCKKDFVMKTLWGKLEVDYIRLGVQGDFLKKIDETIHPDCLRELNQKALSKLYAPIGENDRELAYQILNSQGKTTAQMKDFFLSVYLLERPSKGELFNYAWGRLKELGKSPLRREETLALIKSRLDPLPDDLMGSIDQNKKRAVLNHFKENFPEYFDLYARQCLSYYSGKENFQNGNPTVHCQDLMSSELAPSLLGSDRVEQFQRIKKF